MKKGFFSTSRVFLAGSALFGLTGFGLAMTCGGSQPGPAVTINGSAITGKIDNANPDVRQFLGIPYAKAPVGELRWEPPQAIELPAAGVNATALPANCMSSSIGGLYEGVTEFSIEGTVSEDCLYLSVWSPVEDWQGAPLPVIIYIYGGGFGGGGMDVPYQIPTQWVQRTKEHIVITLNYRVGIFGFPNAEGLQRQNLGLLDQRLAVEWVRDNIAAFNGDPQRIALWGQSAGSMSIGLYAYAFAEDPIVTELMMDSGTESSPGFGEPDWSIFSSEAQDFNCTGTPEAQVNCMRKISANDIQKYTSNVTQGLVWLPKVDNVVVFDDYSARAEAGNIAKIPAIIGGNAGENDALATFFGAEDQTTKDRLAAGLDTFRYIYYGNFSNISPLPDTGAYHSSELPMLFGTHPNWRGISTGLEWVTSHAMQDAWLAFVRAGSDGMKAVGWPSYHGDPDGIVREFGHGVPAKLGNVTDLVAKCGSAT